MNTETATAAVNRGFQYKHGDRPLDGYTIQRGAGRGGFGEVYYALSDGGREVALKLIQTYEQIELRGVAHCMNLKSPHLITIFDVKYGQDGRPWVIMEFVSGPSLRDLIDASPTGLGTQKAAFFLREIAKGLTYLHDCGIVHRDLKPGNIFYENGYVKIGDYGLSKAISTSQYSGQTVTVGTVHYMAPEIGEGRYDKGIDIYALGALLYEMLTGQVPFFGASPAEVLMKHLSAQVDTSNIEEPFRSVIRKAMAKNPAERYQNVQEMVEDVFGSEHVRNSVSGFTPESLTMVAGHVAGRLPGNSSFAPSSTPGIGPVSGNRVRRLTDRLRAVNEHVDRALDGGNERIGRGFDGAGRRIEQAAERLGQARDRIGQRLGWNVAADEAIPTVEDPIPTAQRRALALIAAGVVAVGVGVAAGNSGGNAAAAALFTFTAIIGGALGILFGRNKIAPSVTADQKFLQHLAVGGFGFLGAVMLSTPIWIAGSRAVEDVRFAWIIVAFAMFLLSWDKRMNPNRPRRVNAGDLIGIGILALIFGQNLVAVGVIAGIMLALQVAMRWNPAAADAKGKRSKPPIVGQQAAAPIAPARPTPPPLPGQSPAMQTVPPPIIAGAAAAQAPFQASNFRGVMNLPNGMSQPLVQLGGQHLRPTSRAGRIIWLIFFAITASIGLLLLLLMPFNRNDAFGSAMMFGFGISALIAAAFCLRRSRLRYRTGPWNYLFRPLIQFIMLTSMSVAISELIGGNLRGDDNAVAIGFLVVPAVLFIAITFLLNREVNMSTHALPVGGPLGNAMTAGAMPVLAQRESRFSLGDLVFAVGRLALTLIASAILLLAFTLALAVVADVPGLLHSNLVPSDIPRGLSEEFGNADWPRMMRFAGGLGCFVLTIIGVTMLLLARRQFGATHMLRAFAGVGVLFIAMQMLGHALPAWSQLMPRDKGWEVVSQYIDQVNAHRAVFAAVPAGVALILLAWPATRAKRARFAVTEEVVA